MFVYTSFCSVCLLTLKMEQTVLKERGLKMYYVRLGLHAVMQYYIREGGFDGILDKCHKVVGHFNSDELNAMQASLELDFARLWQY